MGVLPLEFKQGENRKTLKLDGSEVYDIVGNIQAGVDLSLIITRKNGERIETLLTCRLDTQDEVSVYEAGGVLQRFAQDFLVLGGIMSSHQTNQIKVAATYMRGGTSKAFFQYKRLTS